MTDTQHPQDGAAIPGDTVYFRFGKNGADSLEQVRKISQEKRCTMANVMRDMIQRGLAVYAAEQAILAAHKNDVMAMAGGDR